MSGIVWSKYGGRRYGKSYTLNFDGSHNNQDNKSGAGCIIRDNEGNLVIAAAYSLTDTYSDCCDVAITEAVALRNGLILAKDNNLNINLIKGDSKEVIDHVLDCNRRPARPPLSQIIQQIKGMIDRLSQRIVIVDREANKVADKLAFWGSNRVQEGRMISSTDADLPAQVAELIKQDMSDGCGIEIDNGEGSSIAADIGKAGAALTGAAMLAWGVGKLFFGENSSNDQPPQKNKAMAPWSNTQTNYASQKNKVESLWNYVVDATQNNYASNYHTLHFSGSDINQHQEGGAGCIIRNKKGEFVIAAAYNLNNLYPAQFNVAIAEAVAWKNGLKLAKIKKFKLDHIIGDNEEVINRVRGRERSAPRVPLLSELIHEIREALTEQSIDPDTQVERIGRDDNKIANELAFLGSKLEYKMERIYVNDEELPPKVAMLVQQDKINCRGKGFLM